jgi:hypothetical protein
MNEFENDPQLTEKLAKAAHEVFCDHLRAEGYKYGPQTSNIEMTHSSLMLFESLPEDEKEQNRNTVRSIPCKIACVGYKLMPGTRSQVKFEFQKGEIEKLAEKEHKRWVKQKLENGWQYATVTDKPRKKHKDIVSWDRLSQEDKEKDRVMVRAIPKIVGKAGFMIVRI